MGSRAGTQGSALPLTGCVTLKVTSVTLGKLSTLLCLRVLIFKAITIISTCVLRALKRIKISIIKHVKECLAHGKCQMNIFKEIKTLLKKECFSLNHLR